MTDEGKTNSLIQRLKQVYRLIVLKDTTYSEVGSLKITPLLTIVYLISVVLIILLFFTLFLVYTPLKQYVPGYGKLSSNKPYIKLKERVNTLETELADYKLYVNNFRDMMLDSVQYASEIATAPEMEDKNIDIVERIPADDSLRAQVNINKELLEIATAKSRTNKSGNLNLKKLYLYTPVNGLISGHFNITEGHYGIDIIAPEGSSIKSVADGVVILASNSLETGYTIGIQHYNDLVTYYKHNSSLLKKVGDHVQAGEAIAIIGNTGELTSGPHLHFEMWYKGFPLNPEKYLIQIK